MPQSLARSSLVEPKAAVAPDELARALDTADRLARENAELRGELARLSRERDLYRLQCKSQLAIQFIDEYSGLLEAEDISLLLGQVVEPLETIPTNEQITQFLAGRESYMRSREEVDKGWFDIQGDFQHPEAASIIERRKAVGEAWRQELEGIFGIEGARRIIESP
jgi:hypothetical protein